MAINVANTKILNQIINRSQEFDLESISPEEWQQLINSQNIANIEFLKNILEDMAKKSTESPYLQKVQQLSTQDTKLFTPNKISQSTKMAIIEPQEKLGFRGYQQYLIDRLTQIRIKNHLYQHATHLDLDNMLGSLEPDQKQEKLLEFEFWRKVQLAQSHSGEKRFELLSKALDEAPDSLQSDVKEFKQQLYLSIRQEKDAVTKQRKRLEDNSQEIIQKMIEFRDEKNAWFNRYIKKIMEETKKPKRQYSEFETFILLSQEMEDYFDEPESPQTRLKLIELSQKFSLEIESFFKDPLNFVDPESSLNPVERNIRIKEIMDNIRNLGEKLALDDEQYAIQRIKENITKLETQKLSAKPAQQSSIQASIEIQKNELSYLPIKQATRENLNPYIRIFNEFGANADLKNVPIPMNEMNREQFKRALLCFAEMGENGQFKLKTNPSLTRHYKKLPNIPEHILALERRVHQELGLDLPVIDANFQAQVEKSREHIKLLKEELKAERIQELAASQNLTPDSTKTGTQTLSQQAPLAQLSASRDLINQMNTKPSPAQSLTEKIKDAEKKGPEPTNAPSPKP